MRLIFFCFSILFWGPLWALPKVVVTIPPVHSLTAAIMEGVGRPDLLLEGTQSPHDVSLKPSQIRLIEEADLVIWVGKELEGFLVKPLIAQRANPSKKICTLMEIEGLTKKTMRDWGHEAHDHGADADSHAHCHPGTVDPHIWLDIDNALRLVEEITFYLSALDVVNSQTYEANAVKLKAKLQELKGQIKMDFKKKEPQHYIAMHDGFQYVEPLVGFECAGILAINHDVTPSLKKLNDMKSIIKKQRICCIFTEPQWSSTLPEKLAAEERLCLGVLDPLGAQLPPGSDLYFEMMKNLVNAFRKCLKNELSPKTKA